jgi:hypothetical protein
LALADPGQLPWIYRYREDRPARRLGQQVFRPFVQVWLAAVNRSTAVLDGPIDTGGEIVASDPLAEQLELDLEDRDGEPSTGRPPHPPPFSNTLTANSSGLL